MTANEIRAALAQCHTDKARWSHLVRSIEAELLRLDTQDQLLNLALWEATEAYKLRPVSRFTATDVDNAISDLDAALSLPLSIAEPA